MNSIKSIIPLFAVAGLLLSVPGCAMLSNQDQMLALEADAFDVAYVGTLAALQASPDYRDELELTRDALTSLEQLSEGEIDIDALHGALRNLPLPFLESPEAKLIILGGKILLRRAQSSVDLGDLSSLKPIVTALRQGVTTALLESNPKPETAPIPAMPHPTQ